MHNLPRLLLETGLVQFGRFEGGKPYRLALELLASYPDLLDMLIRSAIPLVGEGQHLLSTADALPFGVGLSLHERLPLVYSRGSDQAPTFDLVGAYDIGHSTVLLSNQPKAELETLITNAGIVGLNVRSILIVVDDESWHSATIPMQSIIQLRQIVMTLTADVSLPTGQAVAVESWISRHRGSVMP